ncbi:MAG: cytochrome c family protein [Alphaproteobacteria bacterium]|nr:cytochrome c family protein [Alphaproteobacteria bacterium]
MSGLELNKVAAGVLVAGLLAMVAGKVADGLYHPEQELEKRGYAVEVMEDSAAGGVAEVEKPENILPFLLTADATAGQALTKKCTSCHTFEQGGANKVGPNLYDIVGANVAHKSDYSYSDAMAAHGGTWDYNALSSFLKKPKKHVPGTKMAFAGISKDADRADLIAYLRTLSGSAKPLPTEAEVAASMPEEEVAIDGEAEDAAKVDGEAVPTPAASATDDDAAENAQATEKSDEAIAEEKADRAIQKNAGEETPKGKTPEAEQAQELENSVEKRDGE